jgi:hypothetical protein
MIAVQHEQALVAVSVFGQFTVADFKQLEREVTQEVQSHGPVTLLVDLRDVLGYTLDVALEELKFTRNHVRDFSKIALIAEGELVIWGAWLSRLFTHAQIQVFDDEPLAREWLGEPPTETD